MDKRHQKRLEKILLAILGRRPDLFGIVLDQDGWLSLKELHKVLTDEASLRYLTPRLLKQSLLLYLPEKFELCGNMVRAKSGYRVEGLTKYIEVSPPENLFICVRPKALGSIGTNGLRPMSVKGWIVLASDRELALKMGRRHSSNPALIEIRAALAHERGVTFLRAGESLYLAREIPRLWIKLPRYPVERGKGHEAGQRKIKEKKNTDKVPKSKPVDAVQHAGSFFPRDMNRISSPAQLTRRRKKGNGREKSRRKRRKEGNRR